MTERGNRRLPGTLVDRQDGPDDVSNTAILGGFTANFSGEDISTTSSVTPMLPRYQQIVFIEGNVPEARQLAAGAAAGVLAVILDPNQDGLSQIASFLKSHAVSNLAAIDIVGHGVDGQVQLGTATLSSASMAQYQTDLTAFGGALRAGGAIQLYACDVAQDAAGVAFLGQLSAATGGADVVGASHLVGAASGGGSWDLNVNTGTIDAGSAFGTAIEASYTGELIPPSTTGTLFFAINPQDAAVTSSIQDASVTGGNAVSSTTLTTSSQTSMSNNVGLTGIAVDPQTGRYYVVNNDEEQLQSSNGLNDILGGTIGSGALTPISGGQFQMSNGGSILPWDIALNSTGTALYFTAYDLTTSTGGIWEISLSTGSLTMLGNTANVFNPQDLAIDQTNSIGFFVDFAGSVQNSYIDAENLSTGAIQQIASFDPSGPLPYGIAVNPGINSGTLYYTIGEGSSVNEIEKATYTISGSSVTLGTPTVLYTNQNLGSIKPTSIAIDAAAGVFYVGTDTGSGAVYEGSLGGSAVQSSLSLIGTTAGGGGATISDGVDLVTTPTIIAGATGTLAFTSSIVADSGLTLINSDQIGLATATIAITGSFSAGDSLFLNASVSGITGIFSGDELVLTGTAAALSTWQTALKDVAFSSTSKVNSVRTLSWTGSDGLDTSNTATSTVDVICFCAGTNIATSEGEVQVQSLAVGDTVLTANNGPRKITWVGRGKVLATRGRRSAATPVIVRKGALAPNVPNRDLRVTKAHSLYIDDVLIPVEFLVNHKSILWDDRAQEVEIYHIELESHDVLLANGAPAESYRDDGNRWLFQNANSGWGLPPQEPYAPVLTGGPVVDAVWKRVLDRVGQRDLPPLTDDPDLHLVVDGKRVDVAEVKGPERVFRLAACSKDRSIAIASREGVPAELGLTRDPRSLGVALRRVVLRSATKLAAAPANDARLMDGFHGYEPADNLRWTNGYAVLPAEILSEFQGGAMEVVLTLAGATYYPDFGERLGDVAA